jgi:hypothetical protein
MLLKSGRSVFLNFLSGIFDILARTVGRPTSHCPDDECYCGEQHQNDSFCHKRWLFVCFFGYWFYPNPTGFSVTRPGRSSHGACPANSVYGFSRPAVRRSRAPNASQEENKGLFVPL